MYVTVLLGFWPQCSGFPKTLPSTTSSSNPPCRTALAVCAQVCVCACVCVRLVVAGLRSVLCHWLCGVHRCVEYIELHHSGALSVGASHTHINPSLPHHPLHLSPVMTPCPGFVDLADLVAAILSEGLVRPKAEGFMSRIGQFFTDDVKHHVSHAVNRSARDSFLTVSGEQTLADVGGTPCTRRGP